jgi:quinol-cytochrome oxidoreductase complex cytochrome b subunit
MPLTGKIRVRSKRGLKRLVDLTIYVAIALLFVAAVIGLGVYAARTHEETDPGKWVGFVLVTAVVFADAVRIARGHHDRRLWILIGIFFAAQCGLGVVVMTNVDRIPAVAWVVVLPLNYWAFEGFLRVSLRDRK